MKNLSSKKNETIERFLDKMEIDRLDAERVRNSFASQRIPSFYPGYDAEDVDDGRLDPIVGTGFVRIEDVPNDDQIEESEDFFEAKPSVRTSRCDKDYRSVFYGMLPPIGNVFAIRRGYGLVPYVKARTHPGFIALCKR